MNTKSFFNRCLWRCCRYLYCLLLLGRRASQCLPSDHLFVRLISFSALHSVLIVSAGDIRLLFKLLSKLRNVVKHTESRGSLACDQNIREGISTALEVFLSFALKRNETQRNINRSSTKTSTQRASNIPERTGYNVLK